MCVLEGAGFIVFIFEGLFYEDIFNISACAIVLMCGWSEKEVMGKNIF